MNTYLFILPLVLTIISYTLTTLGAPFFNSLVSLSPNHHPRSTPH